MNKIQSFFTNNSRLIISITYLVAFSFILLNDGLYSDDWVHYDQDFATRMLLFKQHGFFAYSPVYLYELLLNSLAGVFVSRFLTFLVLLLSTLILYSVLKTIKEIEANSRFFLVMFFALFPINIARIYAGHIIWTFSSFFFFVGVWYLSKYLQKRMFVLRLLSVVCFFVSFSTNSLLFFYGLIFLYIVYIDKDTFAGSIFLKIKKMFLNYYDFLLIPIVFWIIKNIWFKPQGLYAGYNEVSLNKLITHPIAEPFYRFFNVSFLMPSRLSGTLFLLILGFIIGFVFIRLLVKPLRIFPEVKKDFIFLFLGIVFFFAGAFPYVLVNKLPNTIDVIDSSRFQILLPLGVSFILFYLFKCLVDLLKLNKIFLILICLFYVLLFTKDNLYTYYSCQRDWYKQLSLAENFKDSEIIKGNTAFLFFDETRDLDAKRRYSSYYEWTGLMKFAFGEDTRFAAPKSNFSGGPGGYSEFGVKNKQYNISHFKPKQNFDYEVTIKYGSYKISFLSMLKLNYLRIFDNAKFFSNVKNIVSLSYKKVGNN